MFRVVMKYPVHDFFPEYAKKYCVVLELTFNKAAAKTTGKFSVSGYIFIHFIILLDRI